MLVLSPALMSRANTESEGLISLCPETDKFYSGVSPL